MSNTQEKDEGMMDRKEIRARAGHLQTFIMIVFCLAMVLTIVCFIRGSYFLAAVSGTLMIANLAIYQVNSRTIRDNSSN